MSVFDAGHYQHLAHFNTHHLFSEKLKNSRLDYSIIKPQAILSSFIDLIGMAEKGRLVTLEKGDKQTNPIYEGGLARICVERITRKNCVVEAGGQKTYTRRQINEIIQQKIEPAKKIKTLPAGLIKYSLPLIKLRV